MFPRLFLLLASLLAALSLTGRTPAAEAPRPNILWLVNEDHGPHVGCYGDAFATTPTFDALAARGLRYARCWSNNPVCAPARTTLLTGLHTASTGAEHMRSMVAAPAGKKAYPQLLREAGWWCTNNAKEDYNIDFGTKLWDESSKKAHWRNRPAGTPFMAVFNSEKSHESQVRKRPHVAVHDPAKVTVPPYHPDAPEVRQDWAQYYDCITAADADAGQRLRELAEAGLTEETIVFYYADHGSGLPGNKRWAVNRGLQVPLVVYIPEKFAHLRPHEYKAGGVSERLVSFVDFAPTLCSLAGIEPPEWMQGHAFLGSFITAPQPFVYGSRARMDERLDCVRSVTDGRFVYVRNFRPDKPACQFLDYMFQTPTTRVWERLFRAGALDDVQASFWKPKPVEELYDLREDPHEVRNLAADEAQKPTLERLRTALRDHQRRIIDVGLLPEGEMHARAAGAAPYDMARDPAKLRFDHLLAAASEASDVRHPAPEPFVRGLSDADAAARHWAALGLLMRGEAAVTAGREALAKALDDPSPDVRLTAAEALLRFGPEPDAKRARELLLSSADCRKNSVFTAMAALNALHAAGSKADTVRPALRELPTSGPVPHARFKPYLPRLLEDLGAKDRQSAAATPAPAADRPNVVYFLVDDLGYADCGFMGGKDIRTPHIDALAKSGAILTDYYVQPVCSPTRAALMTGRYATRTGVYSVVRPGARWGLPLDERTLAQTLQSVGYATAITGKWHLGEFQPAYTPTRRGFVHQYGHFFGAIDYFTHERDGRHDWYRDDKPLQEKGYSTELVAEEACRLIRTQQSGQPLFLYVPFNGIHAPHQVPDKYTTPYAGLLGVRRKIAGMLNAVDQAIGRILAALEETGLRGNTLVIFSSDNGGPAPGRATMNTPLRAGKGTIYEGGVRACACASWPGRIPPGATIREPLHAIDWHPTLAKLTGADVAGIKFDGRDILPALTQGAKSPHEAILLVGNAPHRAAVRAGGWKLLLNADERDAEEAAAAETTQTRENVQLYHLADDIGEKNDLSASHPEKVRELRATLDALLAGAVEPGAPPAAKNNRRPNR